MAHSMISTLKQVSAESWSHFRQNITIYWQTLLLMLGGLLVLGIIGGILVGPANKYLNSSQTLNWAQAISLSLFVQGFFLILAFLWMTFIQGLLIHISLKRIFKDFKELISHFKGDYLKFLSLSIFLILVCLLALIPFYGITLIVIFDLPAKTLISNILLATFIALMITIPWLFVFTPYAMLDKHFNLLQTLKFNFQIVKGKGLKILGFLFFPLALLIILNLILSGIRSVQLTFAINLISIFVLMPLLYSYLGVIYQRFSNSR